MHDDPVHDDPERPATDAPPEPAPRTVLDAPARRYVVRWLRAGAADMPACGFRSLLFGACFVAMGHAIAYAHRHSWPWLPGLAAGFLFVGPLLAVGIYELSRQRRRGEAPDMLLALFAWCRNPRGLCRYAALSCVLLSLWLWTSLSLVGRLGLAEPVGPFVDGGAASPLLSWWLAWIAFSLVAFVSSVVAVPMLLDRPVGAVTAIRTSVACCAAAPRVMALWAIAVALVIGASLWLRFWPLLVTGPWIGHATWHVYRSVVGERPAEARVR